MVQWERLEAGRSVGRLWFRGRTMVLGLWFQKGGHGAMLFSRQELKTLSSN